MTNYSQLDMNTLKVMAYEGDEEAKKHLLKKIEEAQYIASVSEPSHQAIEVLKSEAPLPVVAEFDEIYGKTIYEEGLDPFSSVTVHDLAHNVKGGYIESMETSEEVFLQQNFDQRHDFDCAIDIEDQIKAEMQSPIVAVYNDNTPEARGETRLPELLSLKTGGFSFPKEVMMDNRRSDNMVGPRGQVTKAVEMVKRKPIIFAAGAFLAYYFLTRRKS
jgi:hypothetical protein